MRSFTVESVKTTKGSNVNKFGGRYLSDLPVDAAKKAYSQICKTYRKSGVCSYIITIRETTQGSLKKMYSYRIKRKKNPVDVMLKNGETIEFKYSVMAKSV